MDTQFLIALATMGGLGFIFAGALAIADKKLRVEENPLIGDINNACREQTVVAAAMRVVMTLPAMQQTNPLHQMVVPLVRML